MNRYGDWEELPYREKYATAVDTDVDGEYVCFGGPRKLTIVRPFRSYHVKRHSTAFQKLNLLRWRKESSKDDSCIAATSGPKVYLYHFHCGDLREKYNGSAHPYTINDFDWCPVVPTLYVTCCNRDDTKIWDTRGQAPALCLRSISGAEQAKWALQQETVVCTATGGDLRLWDIRLPKFPTRFVEAHVDKIKCLAWLPKRPSCFVSSGLDCYIKYNGDELATLSKRSYGKENFMNTVTVFKTKDPMRFQTLKSKEDDIVDICWRGAVKKRPTDCLFSVSKSGRLRRFEINTLSVADIRVPVAASEDDDDLRAAEVSFSAVKQKETSDQSSSLCLAQHERSVSGGSEKLGYRTYIRLTNVGNSIGTELDILSALKVPGLSVDEINYERAVVTFTFCYFFSVRKIRLRLRFIASNIKYHKLLLEILEDESDLDEEHSALLLELLRVHISGYKFDASEDTAIASGLKKLSAFVGSLKVVDMSRVAVSSLEEEEQAAGAKIPSTEIFTPRDDLVPSPRTCGASFNGSGLLVVFGRAGKKKDEVKALPSMFASDMRHFKRFVAETLKEEEEERASSACSNIPQILNSEQSSNTKLPLHTSNQSQNTQMTSRFLLFQPASTVSTPTEPKKSQFSDDDGCFFPMSMPSSARSTKKRNLGAEVSPRMRMGVSSRTSDLYESTSETTESISDVSKVSVSAPLVIVRSQRHSCSSRAGMLADEHYLIAEAKLVSKIVIYDASELLPVSKMLARSYRLLGGSPLDICLYNMKVAETAGRLDLYQIWSVVELWIRTAMQRLGQPLLMDSSFLGEGLFVPVDDSRFWETHPCGVSMLHELLDHCEKVGDYQTAAIILCTIAPRFSVEGRVKAGNRKQKEQFLSPYLDSKPVQLKTSSSATEHGEFQLRKTATKQTLSGFHFEKKKSLTSRSSSTVPALSTSAPAAVTQSPQRKFSIFGIGRKQKTSFASPVPEGSTYPQAVPSDRNKTVADVPGIHGGLSETLQQEELVEGSSVYIADHSSSDFLYRLVPCDVRKRMSKFLQDYIEMLYRWRIYTKATELMKFNENAPRSKSFFVAYDGKCCGRGCGRVNCKPPRPPFYCAVCQIVVKGLLTTCASCKHGGHIEHLALWFQDNAHCPTGCKCQCLKYR